PLQASGKLFSSLEGADALQREYQGFPGSHFKDILDALVGCIKLFPRRPKAGEVREEMRGYVDYLQRRAPRRPDPAQALREAAKAFQDVQDRQRWSRETRAGRKLGPEGHPITFERWLAEQKELG